MKKLMAFILGLFVACAPFCGMAKALGEDPQGVNLCVVLEIKRALHETRRGDDTRKFNQAQDMARKFGVDYHILEVFNGAGQWNRMLELRQGNKWYVCDADSFYDYNCNDEYHWLLFDAEEEYLVMVITKFGIKKMRWYGRDNKQILEKDADEYMKPIRDRYDGIEYLKA